ncbi:cation efflux family protein family [Xylona heveae TC161]|uniref:Zinc transporter n=1 Tax=Xylona heveae (strain CBS 132557 / TC161) TaxID=1328760 RepID=A0A165JXI9_XYLHT|nr:cation efflux family protein family [Xylona heveae TC161]KZF26749.1 cation efflux family protein family [Xylona heveae TC161]
MASSLPIPVPPKTPTPPPDEDEFQQQQQEQQQSLGLGLEGLPPNSSSTVSYDPNTLSPMNWTFPGRLGSLPSPANTFSPASTATAYSPMTGENAISVNGSNGIPRSPFNFQTTTLARSPVAKSNMGQRRGHKYKHSSVSHQIFLEPEPRAPLPLPASLDIPTFLECRKSMSKEQRSRIIWCCCHMFVAAYTLWSAQESLALTALSHLICFDALGAFLCVMVDVLGNFEVWKRSSIRHPFGLERAEVLAGFAMSVFLVFMGLDLISHNLQHMLEGLGHEPHHEHKHARISPGSVDLASLLAILSTLVSAIGLKNHARIGKAMRFAYIESLPSVLSNPAHFLTLSCSSLLLLLPLLSIQMYVWLDRALSGTIAISMCTLGARLSKTLGFMLLMSYSGGGVSEAMREIEDDPSVTYVEEAKFWQVHYGLCMANLKLRVRGGEDAMLRLRDRVTSIVRNRLGGGYGGGGGQRWEVSTQMSMEKD